MKIKTATKVVPWIKLLIQGENIYVGHMLIHSVLLVFTFSTSLKELNGFALNFE